MTYSWCLRVVTVLCIVGLLAVSCNASVFLEPVGVNTAEAIDEKKVDIQSELSSEEIPLIALLVKDHTSLDPDEQAAFDFGTEHGFIVVPVDPSMLESESTNLSDFVGYWASSTTQPSNWNKAVILSSLRDQLMSGKHLLLQGAGLYIAKYLGYGTVTSFTWYPVVQDARYLVDYQDTPILEGLPRWTENLTVDNESQKLNGVVKPGVYTYYRIGSPFQSSPNVVFIYTTYGWSGQKSNATLDALYNFTSTGERTLQQAPWYSEMPIGAGKIYETVSFRLHGLVLGPMGEKSLNLTRFLNITEESPDKYITYVIPDEVYNSNEAQISVFGRGFSEGVQVSLRNGSLIIPSQSITHSSPTKMNVTFDLKLAPLMPFDLVIEWPDGTVLSKESVVIVRSPLVARYTFNGDASDVTGNGNDGMIHGAQLAPDRFGNLDSAYSFDGLDDYIDIGLDPGLKVQNEISLCAWIKPQSIPDNSLWAIVTSQNDPSRSGTGIYYDSRLNSIGQPSPRRHICHQIGDGSWHESNANAIVAEDEWTHIVVTRKANEPAQFYYNGILQSSTSVAWTGSIAYTHNWTIGRQSDFSDRYFKGFLDDVSIYRKSLTANEVRELYLKSSSQPFIVSPKTVTNTSNVQIQIYGLNFTDDIQVILQRDGNPIITAQWVFHSSASMLVAKFDLSSISLGEYDVTLERPDGIRETVSGALSIKALPEGVILEKTDLQMSPGIPQTFSFTVPDSPNLFVTLQKVQYPGDPHWNWDGTLSLVNNGTEVANSRSNQDQILHLVNPEPGEYNITVSSTSTGSGILKVWTALPAFPDGNWVVDPIYRPYGSTFRQIEIPSGKSSLTFNAQAIGMWSRFDVYKGQWGTGQHWISSSGPNAALTIPNPPAGLYIAQFMDTQMITGDDQQREVMLKASTTGTIEPPPVYLPMISSFAPVRGGNAGTITMEIEGAWLEPNATVDLTQDGIPLVSALSVNGTEDKRILSAVFDLTNEPVGSYNVTVTNPDGISINGTSPFHIEEGGRSEFWTEIFGRETIRAGRPATYLINYGNNGTLDMPAPLLSLTTDPPSSTIYIRFPPSTEWRQMTGPFTVIARGPDENPDIIPAGSSYSMEIEVNTNEYGEFTLVSLPYGGDPIFTPRTVESVIDAAAPSPGIPLSFGRTYPGGYSAYQGPFGYGWVHTYDLQLERFGDGNYGVRNGDAYILLYLRQSDGKYTSEDGSSNLTVNPDGTSAIRMRDGSALTFNANKRPITISDLNGNHVTLVYTGSQLTGIQHSDGDQFTLEYGPNGKISRLTDQAGKQTVYSYNPESTLLTSVTSSDGSITQYTYAEGETGFALVQTDYPGGFTQRFENDGDGRLVGTSLNNKEAIPLTYSEEERTTTMSDALGSYVIVKVNEAGQPVRTENALGATQQFSYNQDGDPIRAIDPLENSYQIEYNDNHKPTRITDPLGHTTAFSYEDQFNKVNSVTDGRGNTLTFSYDPKGNLAGITYPDSQVETLVYDDNGNVIRKTTRKGDVINYQYNFRGQLTRVDYPDGTYLAYTYDSVGNMLTSTNQDGTISFEYNARNQPIRIVYPNGNSFNYTYNNAGFLTERTEKDGYKTTYSYDDIGNLIRVSNGTGSTIVSYVYETTGKLVRKAVRNGAFTTYEYDSAGQILRLVNYNKDGTVLSQFEYTYDAAGNPIEIDTVEGTYEYDYDLIGQLTGVKYPDGHSTQYSYDAAGNRVSTIDDTVTTTYTTNAMNQHTLVGIKTFEYDGNGNLVQMVEGGNVTIYEYNFENRLIKVTSPKGVWEYTYDSLGNRIGVKENSNQTWYSIDPLGLGDIVAEYDASGILISRYTHGLGLISKIDAFGSEYEYHFTPVGHTSEITSSSGDIVNQYKYTPFGEHREKSERIRNHFTYVGEQGVVLDKSELFNMRMRQYNPNLGRFTTEDYIGFSKGNANLYLYTNNNPLKYIDPTGFFRWPGVGLYSFGNWIGLSTGGGKTHMHNTLGDTNVPGLFPVDKAARIHDILCYYGISGAAKKSKEWLTEDLASRNERVKFLGLTWQFLNADERMLDQDIKDRGWVDAIVNKDQSIILINRKGYSLTIPAPNEDSRSIKKLKITGPLDPEDKFGPTGFDPAGTPRDQLDRYIVSGTPLTYRVDFWNAENATGTICDVWAHDQLDSDLNWSTFGFTSVGFTNWTIPLDGAPSFEVYIDTRPDMNYTVRITGDYNPSTGNITLEYHTLDPISLETPEDPLAGFLPPIASNEIGWFEFTVQPDPGLTTGTKLENQAWVKFDTLDFFPAPPEGPWVNTIDAGAPSSSISVSLVNETEMVCTFSGSDDSGGSGIKDYTIYLSDNGSAYQPALNHIKTSPATLHGVPGHTYTFYSIARDNVGNIESAPVSPDSTLTVPYPTSLTLISPNGGENYPRGSTKTIQWSYVGSPGSTVMIELLKGTVVDKVLSSNTTIGSGGMGSYSWTVPYNQIVGSDYKIRITSTSNSEYADMSQAPFSIGAGSPITVVSPNGGEKWKQGSTQTLKWKYTGDPGSSVKIEVIKGSAVRSIAPNTSIGSDGSGSFNFTFPFNAPLGSDYQIRVTSTSNATYTDTSDAPFSIIPPITVLSPNGGEEWQQGSAQTISWDYVGNPGPTLKIEALRGDTVLAVITPGTPVGSGGMGSMNLTLPINAPIGTEYRIRVSSTSNTIYTDTSDEPFKISANTGSSIELVSPNGGENYVQGSMQTIRWDYTGNPGSIVKIEALRGETVLATVASSHPIGTGGTGFYNLTFPYNTPLGSDYRIRISSTGNPAWTDTSDAPFTIIPAITVTSPDGGETWHQGSMHPITWTFAGNPGPAVKIEALRGDAVLAVVTPSTPIGTGGSGSYNLTFPTNTPIGNNYRIRVSSTNYPLCFDVSNGPFAISAG